MKFTRTLTLKRSNYPLNQIAVKKAMLDAGLRMTDLARRFDVNPATISLTIAGKTCNLAIQQAIAAALKLPIESLWDMTPRKTRKRKLMVRPSSQNGEALSSPLAAAGGK